jgi:hypothetical protein
LDDLLVIVAAVLIVLGGARMTVSIRPVRLVLLGVLLLVVTLAGPGALSYVLPNMKIDRRTPSSFLIFAALEFVGAILLGAGLRRLLLRKQSELPVINEERKVGAQIHASAADEVSGQFVVPATVRCSRQNRRTMPHL